MATVSHMTKSTVYGLHTQYSHIGALFVKRFFYYNLPYNRKDTTIQNSNTLTNSSLPP